MKMQRRGKSRETATERWARECPGQFLYVITFGPEPRRRRRSNRRTPIAPWRPPVVMRPGASMIEPKSLKPKSLKQREDA